MEKLRFLLNEFDPYICKDWEHRDNLWYSVICWESAIFTKEIWVQKIISKEYKFIKWLVENDKIDVKKLAEKSECEVFLEFRRWEKDRRTDTVIMILAIQEDPIWFLISILK